LIAFDIDLMGNARPSFATSQAKPDNPGFARTSWQVNKNILLKKNSVHLF
jgi:hypothetical protein